MSILPKNILEMSTFLVILVWFTLAVLRQFIHVVGTMDK